MLSDQWSSSETELTWQVVQWQNIIDFAIRVLFPIKSMTPLPCIIGAASTACLHIPVSQCTLIC